MNRPIGLDFACNDPDNLTCGDSRLSDVWRHPDGLTAFRPLLLTLIKAA